MAVAEDRKLLSIAGFTLVGVAGYMLLRGSGAKTNPTKPVTIRSRYSLRTPQGNAGIDAAIQNWDLLHPGVPVLNWPDSSAPPGQVMPTGPAATIGWAPWDSQLWPAPGSIRTGPVAWPGQSNQFVPVIWPVGTSGAQTAWINKGDLK